MPNQKIKRTVGTYVVILNSSVVLAGRQSAAYLYRYTQMNRIMSTPNRARTVAIYIAIVWLCAPLVEVIYYQTELNRGSFPPEADAIMIPIMQFTIGWLISTPVAAAFVYWVLKSYPGSVSLLSWNKEKRIKSYTFTAILVTFAAMEFVFAFQSAFRNQIADFIFSLLHTHIILLLRASIVMAYNKKFEADS